MTDVIDHSALAETRIATQYKASEKFRAYIRALMAQSQELEGVFTAIAESRDIDLATGDQLDIIGEIVGVSRLVNGVIVVPFFGFEGVLLAQPFGEEGNLWVGGRFYEEGEETTGTSVLADPEYRLLIRAKIVRNHSKGTCEDIMNALTYLFDGAPSGIVDDIGGMAIDIGIGRQLTNIEYALITELDILPRPAGVRINRIINYTSGAVFGFEGQPGVLGFGEEGDPSVGGIFAEDVTDGLPAYPEVEPVYPEFTGYFDSFDALSEPTIASYTVSGDGLTIDIEGGTTDGALSGFFSTACDTGRHLMILKLTNVVDDPTAGFSVEFGFVRISFGPDEQIGVYIHGAFNPGNYGNRSGSSAVAIRQPPDTPIIALSNFGGQSDTLSPQYIAIAYDMDSGIGHLLSPWGDGTIEDMPIISGGSGVWGTRLAGESVRAFITVTYNASAYGTTSTGGEYSIELVPSSAPHGLTLPSGYTNIVPD